MSTLELKKKEMEIKRVQMAKEELEFRIEERLDEINRIKEHIKVQDETLLKLKEELTNLKK